MDLTGTRVLVTGGAGFLGEPVCVRLRECGALVSAPRSREFDLTDPEAAARLFVEARPELVVHLAAEVGGIGANRAEPGRFIYANLSMGLHVIEAARLAGVQKFVQVGTVCSYPKLTPTPFSEDRLWDGYPEETNAPYGIAKRALLVMLDAYREQYGLQSVFLMPVNLYGPRDDFDPDRSHVIPALIRRCEQAREDGARTITCWGSGAATREFLHVEDCARAIVLACERCEDPRPINLGSGREIAVRELAETIARLTGFDGEIEWDATQPDGQPRRLVDGSRARASFGFRPSIDLEEGLLGAIEWFRELRLVRGRRVADRGAVVNQSSGASSASHSEGHTS
ncbi:MAG TPA: GDP-L-fucose synthase [Solirubrobacteraceae bacterium]|jgi:GDP-L-fucose synthase|nr:GDP-L-fucose synthase [Solirubrobacteraceae bacterium]